jgi:hypothetical protein
MGGIASTNGRACTTSVIETTTIRPTNVMRDLDLPRGEERDRLGV